jgi:hypothetical protein
MFGKLQKVELVVHLISLAAMLVLTLRRGAYLLHLLRACEEIIMRRYQERIGSRYLLIPMRRLAEKFVAARCSAELGNLFVDAANAKVGAVRQSVTTASKFLAMSREHVTNRAAEDFTMHVVGWSARREKAAVELSYCVPAVASWPNCANVGYPRQRPGM